jgi:predicted Zn-ribbon and HTH transcriptional regulator
MEDATFYKCGDCGYEFLAKAGTPACPRCKSNKLETKDIRTLAQIDE